MPHDRITFTLIDPDNARSVYSVTTPTDLVVGRAADCDIHVPNDLDHGDISRHHCVLEVNPPDLRVRDLGSRNGTFVNGVKIGQRSLERPMGESSRTCPSAARELKKGDEVRVGNTLIQVGVDPSGAAAPFVDVPQRAS